MSRRPHSLTPLFWILACLLVSAAPAAGSAEPALEEFDGTWIRVNREPDDEAREAALLRATESMSFLLRGSTRLFMRRSMTPPERCVIRVEGRSVTIVREPGPTTRLALGVTEEGSSVTFENGELRREWRHDDDTRGTTVWRFSADGEHLLVRRRIHNELLGGTADYTSTYARER